MFSGIVEGEGTVVRKEKIKTGLLLTISTNILDKPLKLGESICVSGVCLTVVRRPLKNRFCVELVPATIRQTTFQNLGANKMVNLERSLKWGDRLSGHFVMGHVDGVGKIIRRQSQGKNLVFDIEAPKEIERYLVSKGSIAVDGVSLTIQHAKGKRFQVSVIPHSAGNTSLGRKMQGSEVNLEADILAKHLDRFMTKQNRLRQTKKR